MKTCFKHALPNWYPRFRDFGITWLAAIKVTPRERIVAREESLLQEEVCITEVEVSEQQTDDILLIDVDNRQYEDLFDDMTDEESEEEFDASDDNHCTDIVENSNDSEWCNICFKYFLKKYINQFKT